MATEKHFFHIYSALKIKKSAWDIANLKYREEIHRKCCEPKVFRCYGHPMTYISSWKVLSTRTFELALGAYHFTHITLS